ncbi:rare lipoprotein A [Arboricoccus pini]|uniref:Endolytic peptidoglycan transglycosylase RlpA n=1 Tax=Arboricoccus pini TaxID=1963835 RepID=A0A212PWP8_9PROT|nr:septal ring lytic transglycosylase RlpA family protein [Arboricoccus pini]SNB51452.1 rare lipoprotein A [Arboricoccus pini]
MKPRHIGMAFGLLGLLAMVGCSSSDTSTQPDPAKLAEAQASQKRLPSGFKLGKPYQIKGKWYYPEYDPNYQKIGIASWYGDQFQGLATANGEIFDKNQITAAHPTLPIPSNVRVTDLDTGRSIVVRVNDRGPYHGDREIDLSQAAARELGYEREGVARVKVEFLGLADGIQPPPGLVYASAKSPGAQPGRSVLTATALPARSTPKPPLNPSVPAYQEASYPEAATALDIQPRSERNFARAAVNPAKGDLTRSTPGMVAAVDDGRQRRMCVSGPQFVQIGAFADTERVRMAQDALEGLGDVRTDPVFVNQRAAMRVRVGPLKDHQSADRILSVVQSKGYGNAFVVPAVASAQNVPC